MTFQAFDKQLVTFLKSLAKNSDKKWFDANKARFREHVQDPMLAFIKAMAGKFAKSAPHITAVAKRQGGSLQRIYRDTRFSKDKSPYNTYVAARFAHTHCEGGTAPGYYLRIDTKNVTLGCGIWQPDTPLVTAIRQAIVDDPKGWQKARSNKKFVDTFGELQGESLKRPPRGFDPEHEFVDDLRRKDFVGFCEMPHSALVQKGFVANVSKSYAAAKPLMQFVCKALDLPF